MKQIAFLPLLAFLLIPSLAWPEEPDSSGGKVDQPGKEEAAKPTPGGGGTPGGRTPIVRAAQLAVCGFPPNLEKVGDVLVVFILAVLFEEALRLLFNWKLFLERSDGKGWESPLTIGQAFLKYDLDIVRLCSSCLGGREFPRASAHRL